VATTFAPLTISPATGVATMTPQVAQQILKTIEACRLLGATIIVTGLSHGIANTLVSIGRREWRVGEAGWARAPAARFDLSSRRMSSEATCLTRPPVGLTVQRGETFHFCKR
jgi:hypothetical protein